MAVVHAPMVHLALIGLRRGALAGMRWSAIDLDPGRITVAVRTRVRVTGQTIDQKNGRSKSARRSLKLPASVLTVLRGTQERQQFARKRAGDEWGGLEISMCSHSGMVDQWRRGLWMTGGRKHFGTRAYRTAGFMPLGTRRRHD
ncbi:hypothetical protein ACSVIA_01295 [Rhodococcus erythropolis]|uniref:hypothetical protein n=1 Tax=Rhodococcus erythropolis TaxID=1833 RepID=UPI004041903F